MNGKCIICGQGHDDQEEVPHGSGFYHEECYAQGEPVEDEPSAG